MRPSGGRFDAQESALILRTLTAPTPVNPDSVTEETKPGPSVPEVVRHTQTLRTNAGIDGPPQPDGSPSPLTSVARRHSIPSSTREDGGWPLG